MGLGLGETKTWLGLGVGLGVGEMKTWLGVGPGLGFEQGRDEDHEDVVGAPGGGWEVVRVRVRVRGRLGFGFGLG